MIIPLNYGSGQEDINFAKDILNYEKVQGDELLIALGIGAGSKRRMWPIDNFVEMCRWLKEKYNAKIIIVGGKKDEPIGTQMYRKLGEIIINTAGRTTLRQSAALLKLCHFYLGNDTGTMHLTAAVNNPIVEISCHPLNGYSMHSNSPLRFGPWKVPYIAIQPKEPRSSNCEYGCCSEEAHCILNVTVEQVKDAVIKIIDQIKLLHS